MIRICFNGLLSQFLNTLYMIFTAQLRGRQGYLSSTSINGWNLSVTEVAVMHVLIQILNLWTYYVQAPLETVLIINLAATMTLLLLFRYAIPARKPMPAERDEPAAEQPAAKSEVRHRRLDKGFRAYVRQCFEEYLSPAELELLVNMLVAIRDRDPDEKLTEKALRQICVDDILRSRHMASRTLRKYNLYAFAYNLTGYLNISRREAAMMLKTAFPNVFLCSSIHSIDKSLSAERDPTKLEIRSVGDKNEFEKILLNYK